MYMYIPVYVLYSIVLLYMSYLCVYVSILGNSVCLDRIVYGGCVDIVCTDLYVQCGCYDTSNQTVD